MSPIQQLLAQQIEMMAKNTGKSSTDLWNEIGHALKVHPIIETKLKSGSDLVVSVEPVKRKYNRCKPVEKARDLELSSTATDERGRTHQVVMRRAFNGEVKAWKIVDTPVSPKVVDSFDALSVDRGLVDTTKPVQVARPSMEHTSLVDYPDSDDENDVDADTPSPPPSPEMKSKRKYTSKKPPMNPKELDAGTKMDHQGKVWVVAVVATRGSGRRSMWKLAPDTEILSQSALHDITSPIERTNAVGPDDTIKPNGIWAEAIHRQQHKLTWSCPTCLVENEKLDFQCLACQSLSPKAQQTLMDTLVDAC